MRGAGRVGGQVAAIHHSEHNEGNTTSSRQSGLAILDDLFGDTAAGSLFEDSEPVQLEPDGYLQGQAKAIVGHPKFDFAIGGVITINALLLGVQTDVDAEGESFGWQVVEMIFTIIFVTELTLRFCSLRRKFFVDGWCIFDAGLILVSIADLLMGLIAADGEGQSSLHILTVLRLLRLMRLVRVIRLIRLFRPLYLALNGLVSSIGTLGWVSALLLLVFYLFGIFTTRMIGQDPAMQGTEAQEAFSSVPRSMLSLFVVMTTEGWYGDFAEPVMENQPAMALFFIIFLVVTTFSVLNVLTALIVEATLSAAAATQQNEEAEEDDVEEKKYREIAQSFFTMGDTDGNQTITGKEFRQLLEQEEVRNLFAEHGYSHFDALQLFHIWDADQSDQLDLKEFLEGMSRLRKDATARDVAMSQYKLQRSLNQLHERYLKATGFSDERWGQANGRLSAVAEKLNLAVLELEAQQHPVSVEKLDHTCSLVEEVFSRVRRRKSAKKSSRRDPPQALLDNKKKSREKHHSEEQLQPAHAQPSDEQDHVKSSEEDAAAGPPSPQSRQR